MDILWVTRLMFNMNRKEAIVLVGYRISVSIQVMSKQATSSKIRTYTMDKDAKNIYSAEKSLTICTLLFAVFYISLKLESQPTLTYSANHSSKGQSKVFS